MLTYDRTTKLIDIARRRGSSATTAAGAKRYLLSHLSPALSFQTRATERGRVALDEYLRARDEARAERICRAYHLITREEAEAWADDLTRAQLPTWQYRRSESRWAGGEHTTTLKISDEPGVEAGTERVRSKNRKWVGTNSYAHLRVTARAIQCFPDLLAAGLVVLDAVPVAHREYQMTWVEQGRGCSAYAVQGWFIRGHHVAGGTLEEARKKARIARRKTVRARLAARLAKRHRPWALTHVFVSPQDSVAAGNCPAGTDQAVAAIQRDLGEIGGIRADELLRRRDDVYTRRAVDAAIVRYVHAHRDRIPA